MALFGSAAISSLSPECAPKPTFPGRSNLSVDALARRLPVADQRKHPSSAEQQQDGKTIDKGTDRDQQYQRGLVAERVHLRELDLRKFGGNPERRGDDHAANHELGERLHQRLVDLKIARPHRKAE